MLTVIKFSSAPPSHSKTASITPERALAGLGIDNSPGGGLGLSKSGDLVFSQTGVAG